jgi:hypothetical protein
MAVGVFGDVAVGVFAVGDFAAGVSGSAEVFGVPRLDGPFEVVTFGVDGLSGRTDLLVAVTVGVFAVGVFAVGVSGAAEYSGVP